MSTTGRDYRVEYRRRIRLGLARGLSRSAARGHLNPAPSYERGLEEALKRVRDGDSVSHAAHAEHVAPERLRTYLRSSGIAQRRGRRWTVGQDRRPRVVPIFSRGRRLEVTVPGYEPAKIAGLYMQTVYGPFLADNDPSVLVPFAGKGVHDTAGRYHPFEIRPNELYRLTLAGPEPYEEIYKIVV